MATYVNNLRLKEITTGDESGTFTIQFPPADASNAIIRIA